MSDSSKHIFEEAIRHCRWKHVLCNDVLTHSKLQEGSLHEFLSMSFEEILLYVHDICSNVKGIGMLSVYDITSAICRYNKINIEKIYIVGNGPKKAIRLLDVQVKIQKIQNLRIKYVEIPEIIKAFTDGKYEIDLHITNSVNGDDFESYICNWQKDK